MATQPALLRLGLLAALSIFAAACASSDETATTSGATSSTTAAADADADQPSEPEPADDTTTTTVVSGPTTTFVPALEGPFDTTGGISFDPDGVESVIVELEPDLPGTLSQLPFETDWTRRTVEDWSEFLRGLQQPDPRDVIQPLDSPVFESPSLAAQWLGPREPGALVQLDGEVRFYPLSILTRHEIVNDAFGDVPVAVTFCPLCNTAIAYDRRVNGEVLRFGVSGLLRNSDLVMWDDWTTSLWQQITGEGVVGDFAGAQLDSVPTSIVSFEQFVSNFPDGKSLAAESGFGRGNYGVNPYSDYSSLATPFLFDGEIDGRLPALSRVVGITDGDTVASYSFERLGIDGVINDEVDGRPIVVFLAGDTADALGAREIAIADAIGSGVALDPVVDGEALTFSATDDGHFVDQQTESTWTIVGRAIAGPLEGTQLGSIEHRNEFWFAWQAFFGPDSLREKGS